MRVSYFLYLNRIHSALLIFFKLYADNYHHASIQIVYSKLLCKYGTASFLRNKIKGSA